ncbi:MAG: hypothetical protein FJ264_17790 [Planctomycetes bacterium]|nr:hypothetical protein [Planctomycetota bacterium]MBM4067101.1 hypothetical protein [Planctomycetota bacterium]
MAGKTRIKDMKDNKCINIPLGVAEKVFQKLGIDTKTSNLMDAKRVIFNLFGLDDPYTKYSSRKKLYEQRLNNAYGIKITDEEMKKFMKLFNLSEEDNFQESIGGRIVSDILNGNVLPNKVTIHPRSSAKHASSSRTKDAIDIASPPDRVQTHGYLILRDTELALHVKRLHRFECQLCGHTIELPDGRRYAESHHIQPLGQPHNGPDVIGNILCVCPNHHAELDYGVPEIFLSRISCTKEHPIEQKYIDYHNLKIHNSTNS